MPNAVVLAYYQWWVATHRKGFKYNVYNGTKIQNLGANYYKPWSCRSYLTIFINFTPNFCYICEVMLGKGYGTLKDPFFLPFSI